MNSNTTKNRKERRKKFRGKWFSLPPPLSPYTMCSVLWTLLIFPQCGVLGGGGGQKSRGKGQDPWT